MPAFRALRLSLLVTAAVALLAVPAAAHMPPDQHRSQLMPASALGPFDVSARSQPAASARCENGQAGPYPCKNVDLAGFIPLLALGGPTGNDIWGWSDPQTGREYAIQGTSTATGFVDVTDPENPVLVGVLPTRGTPDYVLWRDIKVHENHAFIVSEISGSGLQVFDLTKLRGRTSPKFFLPEGDAAAVSDAFSYAHNISINTESETAYVVGSDECRNAPRADGGENGGLFMFDISDPANPSPLGCALVEDQADGDDIESNNYAHDVECVTYDGPDPDHVGREICFGSNENAVVIYDVTDKADPRVLSATTYPQATYTHQGALTEDRRFFLFGDELDEQEKDLNTTTYILDVADLDDPPTPKAFTHATKSIDHNQYVHGNRAFQSNYTAGLRILEFDTTSLQNGELNEVGFFDVVPGVDIDEFAGTWSNYRFPGSGTVVLSAIENEANGMFVLRPQLPASGTGGGDAAADPGAGQQAQQQQQQQPGGEGDSSQARKTQPCATAAAFRSADAQPRGRRVGFSFTRSTSRPVRVDVFQTSIGRRVIGERLVARFSGRRAGFSWNGKANRRGRKVRDGYYFVRFRAKGADGRVDTRRDTLRRVRGRWSERPAFYRRKSCGLLTSYKLERPVFGGRTNRSVLASYRLGRSARVTLDVLRGKKVVKRYRNLRRRAGITYRQRFDSEPRERGDYRFRITVVRDGKRTVRTLVSRRL